MKNDLYRLYGGIGLVACMLAGTAFAQKSILNSGEFLPMGQYLVSPNKRAFLIQQDDGNLCLYAGSGPGDNKGALWCTMKYVPKNLQPMMGIKGFYLTSQSDGNLCVYKGTSPKDSHGDLWCHMQYGPQGPYFTQLRDDGIVCTYKGYTNQIWNQQWCNVAPSAPKQLPPGVVDINQATVDALNTDPNRPARLIAQAIGAQSPDLWYIESMKITQLTNTLVDVKMPEGQWWVAKTKTLVTCAPTTGSTEVILESSVSNSVTLSTSNTFEASVSATVSYSGLFVSGSVTATAGYSMTNASAQTDTKDTKVSDTTSVNFPDAPSGRLAVLWAMRYQGKAIPWSASFTPKDDQQIDITVRKLGNNDRVSGKLPWIQLKNYIPADKRTFTVGGTVEMDRIDPDNKAVVVYPMSDADVKATCNLPPKMTTPGGLPGGTFGGSEQSASAARPSAAAVTSARATPAGARNPAIIEKEHTVQELQSRSYVLAPPPPRAARP